MIARQTISNSSNRGFTLLEVMVAMVITLVGLLGLLQSVNIATEHNMKNQLREEALQVGEDYLYDLQARPFARLSTPFSPRIVPSRLLGTRKDLVVNRTNSVLPNSTARELVVKVSWLYKNVSSHHEVRTVKSE
ncbi:MAG: hypothetical protein A2075_06730 [Geobacteraceae bacterium GWC2_58_44]|nr:MAG: hypothetical protein A2075_06730 [Geobacteraceae bacterium GWC2_58_44]HBG08250.1 pilus assembly protein PilV [Geobacter sp.]